MYQLNTLKVRSHLWRTTAVKSVNFFNIWLFSSGCSFTICLPYWCCPNGILNSGFHRLCRHPSKMESRQAKRLWDRTADWNRLFRSCCFWIPSGRKKWQQPSVERMAELRQRRPLWGNRIRCRHPAPNLAGYSQKRITWSSSVPSFFLVTIPSDAKQALLFSPLSRLYPLHCKINLLLNRPPMDC